MTSLIWSFSLKCMTQAGWVFRKCVLPYKDLHTGVMVLCEERHSKVSCVKVKSIPTEEKIRKETAGFPSLFFFFPVTSLYMFGTLRIITL